MSNAEWGGLANPFTSTGIISECKMCASLLFLVQLCMILGIVKKFVSVAWACLAFPALQMGPGQSFHGGGAQPRHHHRG